MKALDIATIIVSYHCAPLTIEALRSLHAERSRTGLPLRAIVIDNASGDLAPIEQEIRRSGWGSWATVIAAPRNGGFAYGNNLGIERAFSTGSPSYIYLLNPDAQVRPGAVQALVSFLEAHPAVGIAGSSFENLDGSDWPIAFRFPTLQSEVDQGLGIGVVTRLLRRWVVARSMSNAAQPVDWICGASMMFRPAVLAAIGGFDENYFLYYEETDFCRRALDADFPTWYVPDSRVMHISGQSTGVTKRVGAPTRIPPYWFESRRRYFAATYGTGRAICIDLAAIVAHSLGLLKRLCMHRTRTIVPHFIRDLVRHSIIWPSNRSIPAVNCGPLRGLMPASSTGRVAPSGGSATTPRAAETSVATSASALR